MPTAQLLISLAIAFAVGSVPFSFLMVKLFGRDIREFGEGNPGSANAFRASGMKAGLPSVILDSFKGVIPVALLTRDASGYQLPLIAIAPVLGHAFSPFLKMRGGKAIATSFGIWTALTVWTAPAAMGIGALASLLIFKKSSDMAKLLIIFTCLAVSLAITGAGLDLWMLFVANLAIVALKHSQYTATARRKP